MAMFNSPLGILYNKNIDRKSIVSKHSTADSGMSIKSERSWVGECHCENVFFDIKNMRDTCEHRSGTVFGGILTYRAVR